MRRSIITLAGAAVLVACGSEPFGPPELPPASGPPLFTVTINDASWLLPDSSIPALQIWNTNRVGVTAVLDKGPGAWETLSFIWAPAEFAAPQDIVLSGTLDGIATYAVYTNYDASAFFTTTSTYTGRVLTGVMNSDSMVVGAFAFEAISLDGRSRRRAAGQFRLRVLPPA